jgi:hypothetical protein
VAARNSEIGRSLPAKRHNVKIIDLLVSGGVAMSKNWMVISFAVFLVAGSLRRIRWIRRTSSISSRFLINSETRQEAGELLPVGTQR